MRTIHKSCKQLFKHALFAKAIGEWKKFTCSNSVKNYDVIAAAEMGNLCLLFITKTSTIIWLSIEYGVGCSREIFQFKMIQFNVNQRKTHRMPNYDISNEYDSFCSSRKNLRYYNYCSPLSGIHAQMRAAEIVMMDTNRTLFPFTCDNAAAVDQTISQTKRVNANYASVQLGVCACAQFKAAK